jgi:putative cardiolipin synthase
MCQARLCFLLIVLPGLVGCILDDARIESNAHMAAFADHESTRIGRQLADLAAANPDKSGFAIIRYGRPALAARVALADLAEHTLDVQYYIWEADATGRILAERLVRAADRGVRVRILVDDINLSGRDARVASLDAHPNIEIRIFNPFANRKFRVLDFAFDLARVNHRMHNKMMIMDNALTLVGGRNVGAHYFQAHTQSNFRDLDIVGAGPIVRDTSEVFERFWDGPWSVPVAQLVKKAFGQEQLVAAVADMRRQIEADDYPFPLEIDTTELLDDLENIFDNLVWAPGQIVWEDPTSIYEGVQSGRMNEALLERLETLESELLIESAYFVPRETGVAVVRSLTGRGIRVRVLTNSLVANDVLAAHAGYSKYRRPLLESGTELYELRPYPGPVDQKIVSTKSKAGLHTKAIVFDRKDVFIGSFNLDPRSSMINTEAGLYVESPALARQVIDYMDEGVSPHNAFRVLLGDNEALHWVIEVAGAHVEYDKDPNSSWYQRWLAGVIRSLPIEDQL